MEKNERYGYLGKSLIGSYLAGWTYNPKTARLESVFVADGKVLVDSDLSKQNETAW